MVVWARWPVGLAEREERRGARKDAVMTRRLLPTVLPKPAMPRMASISGQFVDLWSAVFFAVCDNVLPFPHFCQQHSMDSQFHAFPPDLHLWLKYQMNYPENTLQYLFCHSKIFWVEFQDTIFLKQLQHIYSIGMCCVQNVIRKGKSQVEHFCLGVENIW